MSCYINKSLQFSTQKGLKMNTEERRDVLKEKMEYRSDYPRGEKLEDPFPHGSTPLGFPQQIIPAEQPSIPLPVVTPVEENVSNK